MAGIASAASRLDATRIGSPNESLTPGTRTTAMVHANAPPATVRSWPTLTSGRLVPTTRPTTSRDGKAIDRM